MSAASIPDLSVVVPLYNEEESLPHLVAAVRDALTGAWGTSRAWELVLVDDGSRDRTVEVATAEAARDARVRLVRLARNYGQTQAMQAGFDQARGHVVVSMDGDLQNDPRDIPALLAKMEEGYDLVAGYRKGRQDAFVTRKIPSFVANRIIAAITGVRIRDNGCSLKAYRRSVVECFSLYSDQHRFLPALAAATAGARITEIPVRHHPRRFGASKYGLSRILKILGDLLTMLMISGFRERPLAMFGVGALAAFSLFLVFAAAAVVAIGTFSAAKANAYVLPGAALVWLLLAVYLLLLGLVGEVALRASREDDEAVVRLS